ncbi:MAG TPA: serine/threonine-protein kinase [Pyrinomonadaceae bacterium]|nr:serine/threonine-protein kinase [Pyrinomonadaceae bacterium]
MLYCPRCKREYEEGTQRFCVQDGGRLISKTAAARKAASGGIFTSLVEKAQSPNETDEILSLPNFVPVAKSTGPPVGNAGPAGQVEEPPAPDFIRKKEPELPVETFSAEKPAGKQVTMDELPSFQAALGDRKRNPTGRLALSWENPNVLLGHVVRGRYFIERRLNLDDICITYLAQDRAANGKRVIFKVLALGSDFIQNSTEERVALSHLNHPHIVKILDSGEMPEGMPFAVFEYVEGESLREVLDSGDPLAASDTARIAKQVSEALSGAQQNGVLHYDVRPQKIILKPEADGSKIAKVTDFALAKGYKAPSVRKLKDVAYQSPEQLQGRELSPASESYSLAAIAYEMLTGRLPYNFTSMRELLDSQRGGLRSKPTMILPELPGQVDEIFTRALAFEPEKRYQKARDFGEAIYNALGNFAMSDEILVIDDTALAHDSAAHDLGVASPGKPPLTAAAGNDVLELSNPVSEVKETAPVHASPAPAWEKRAAENQRMSGWAIATACLIGLLLIAGGIFVYLNYFTGEQPAVVETNTDTSQATADTNQAAPPTSGADADSVPPPREITPSAGSVAFQNSKDDLPAALKKNFRGFSVYYPGTWVKNKSDKNFLDISRSTENGTPIEQILVSWYESKGTFTEDSANFPKLAKALNDKWSESIPNFQAVSQGEDFVNGRKVFQVKFQGEGETNTGEKITIWGRTLFMPPGRYGQKNGFVITMLVTSHSPEVLSVDDVGTKGELKEILYSFEPAPLDPAV